MKFYLLMILTLILFGLGGVGLVFAVLITDFHLMVYSTLLLILGYILYVYNNIDNGNYY